MISVELNNRSDYQFDLQNEIPNIVLNNSGDILTCPLVKYVDLFSTSTSSIVPPIVSNGINLILESECPTIVSPYMFGHLEFVLSYNADFVKDGEREADVLYRFESIDLDGWFVEIDSIYDMPGMGYTSSYTTYRYRIKYVATGLVLDLTRPIYFYYRARFASWIFDSTDFTINLSDVYSSYVGRVLDLRKSYFSNTGSSQTNQVVVSLLPAVSDYWTKSWPYVANVHYELYIGKYGNYYSYADTGDWEIHSDSSENPAGFYYFDDLTVIGFGSQGIPSTKEWNKVFFLTDELDSEKALFVVYRAKWDGGETDWISQNLNLVDYVPGSLSKRFYPSSEITIRADTFNERYNAHVIVGSSPYLGDYFQDEDTDDFTKLDFSFVGLVEYSYTGNPSERNRFSYYYNGAVTDFMPNGFNNEVDTRIVYKCSQNYLGDDKIYVFWRFQYEPLVSSSSTSSSSSSSS